MARLSTGIVIIGLLYVSSVVTRPPPMKEHPEPVEGNSPDDPMFNTTLEYDAYLKQVVEALESDPEFRKKLETANVSDIKSGKIAMHLEMVNHTIRTKLDELKRIEVTRLQGLARQMIQNRNGFLQGLHVDVAIGVKTRQAIRSVLNVMREGVNQLIEDGGLDEIEGLLFIKVIESKMKRVMAAPPKLEIPSVKKILSAIPWIDKEEELVNFIQRIAVRQIFQYGETIMKFGEEPDGIYIIISGLVKVEKPIQQGSNTSIVGMLTLDFLTTGNVIGEISVLTSQPRNASATCETIVKTLFLSIQDLALLLEAFSNLNPPLLERLWRMCAMRISLNILSGVSNYHGMHKDTITARLENSVLEAIDPNKQTEVNISKEIMETILLLGELKDPATGDIYTGPCHIPKNARRLELIIKPPDKKKVHKDKAKKKAQNVVILEEQAEDKQFPILFFVLKKAREEVLTRTSEISTEDQEGYGGLDNINF